MRRANAPGGLRAIVGLPLPLQAMPKRGWAAIILLARAAIGIGHVLVDKVAESARRRSCCTSLVRWAYGREERAQRGALMMLMATRCHTCSFSRCTLAYGLSELDLRSSRVGRAPRR